jgi:hypothetical protein
MTHRERVLRTFAFEPTDRAAYDLMEGIVWAELLRHFQQAHGCEREMDVLDRLDTDCRWVFMPYRPSAPAEPAGAAPATEAVDSAPAEPPPVRALSNRVAHGPLAGASTLAEVEAFAWPDPALWEPADCAAARQAWPEHALVLLSGWSPLFWGACEAFGVEAALCNLVAAPALFEGAVRCIHERYMERLRRGLPAARGHIDICWLGDDFSTQSSMFVSPEHWRTFIKPCLAEQIALARSHDMLVLYHSCGAVRPVLGDLIDMGVNGLLVFQTTAAGMDPESIAREFGGRLAFYGGMDVQQVLSCGTREDVEAEVRRNVRAFEACGGYIVANSHHCVDTISGANVETMCAAARACIGALG